MEDIQLVSLGRFLVDTVTQREKLFRENQSLRAALEKAEAALAKSKE